MTWNYRPVLRDLLLHSGDINLTCLPALLRQRERFSGNQDITQTAVPSPPAVQAPSVKPLKNFLGVGWVMAQQWLFVVPCVTGIHSLTMQSCFWFTFKRKTNLWDTAYGDVIPTGSLIFQVTVPKGVWSRPRGPPGSYCHFFRVSLEEFLE